MWVWCECSSGLESACLILMVPATFVQSSRRKAICAIIIASVMASQLATINLGTYDEEVLGEELGPIMGTQGEEDEIWIDGGQPWPQSGRTASRIADIPNHSPSGGAGEGVPAESETLLSIVEPLSLIHI